MDRLDEMVVHSNVTSILHLRDSRFRARLAWMCCFRIEAVLSETASRLIKTTRASRNKRICCLACAKKLETISFFSLPFFGHDIGQQAIREC